MNLPFFKNEAEYRAFEKKLSPEKGRKGTLVRCSACQGIHLLTGEQERKHKLDGAPKAAATSVQIRLTDEEIQIAVRDGKARQAKGETHRDFKVDGKRTGEQIHIDGNIGEMAARKYLGMPYENDMTLYHQPDLPNSVEVRTRSMRWYDHMVRVDEHDHARTVMAIYSGGNSVTLAGWILGRDGKRFPKRCFNAIGRYYHMVPQSQLRPMQELLNLVKNERS